MRGTEGLSGPPMSGCVSFENSDRKCVKLGVRADELSVVVVGMAGCENCGGVGN
jgi:hypothetical protein